MTIEHLRDELLGIAGVADAELDVDAGTLGDIHIRLETDADPGLVGAEVQRLLEASGVSSRVAPPTPRLEAVPEAVAAPHPVDAVPPEPEAARPRLGVADVEGGGALASLAVEESADSVVVTAVAEDGRRFSRRAAAADEDAVNAAVVAAVGALVAGRPQRLLHVAAGDVVGSRVVTVVVERADGRRVAGAAVVAASVAHAVARATDAALRS